MNQSEKNHAIDCMRTIAAFLVICVHLPFPEPVGSKVILFAQIAVPFFLVICGYFCYREEESEFIVRLKRQIKKIFILFLIANILYVAVAVIAEHTSAGNLIWFRQHYLTKQNLFDFLIYNQSPFGDHLWYLGSLLYALIIMYVLCKIKISKYALFFAPVLLGCYIYLANTGDLEFYIYRNCLIVTLPYFMMGCLIRRYEKKFLPKIHGLVFVGLVVVLSITNILEFYYYQTLARTFVSAELLIYMLVLLLLKYPRLGKGSVVEAIGAKYSLFIYIFHMMPVLYLYKGVHTTPDWFDYCAPVIVFVFSLLVAVIQSVNSGEKYS
ncbi:acyltransferase family protein [Anaeromicropila populeti]|uniref:Surface polysaccharide O-acyltransferase, integral membrane enzyme n=1 Tax=Anaeromicropila populeti TaxID=37658 RepID=A0A1I6JCK3_9FIRM|nr:acyltransferase [Anaeromicropila populeti]SFR76723.1 Surface polysaccharide O-acyltransferase, integral membrane enzyme [Anaeromicropila populeti]